MIDPTRGALYPSRLPTFTRLAPEADAAELVLWFWIPEWDLAPGVASTQEILSFPAANLVVEGGAAVLAGPTTRVGERVLEGRGWAVGALLRPAALAVLTDAPSALVDAAIVVDAPELVAGVGAAMGAGDHVAAVATMSRWLRERVGTPTPEALLAGRMVELIAADSAVLRLEDAARRLAVSPRTLQRLAHRYVGLPPGAMIRRRRLQEAAQRLRTDQGASLAELAAELGYADQSHLANDFREILGTTASGYRNER